MSDTTRAQQDVIEKAWKVLNLQADELLKLSQTKLWKYALGGVVAGAALFGAGFALALLR